MPYYAPLADEAEETCNQCEEKARHLWQSASGSLFPKCDKHMEEAQANEDRYNDITPWSGQNEFGEYYDEDSY